MSERSYPACLRELYESEILGERVFQLLVDHARSPREAYHLGSLLQLETETKARLRPLLAHYGIAMAEAMDLSAFDQIAELFNAVTWEEFMAANVATVEEFIGTFEAIVALGPDSDRDILQSMVTHERAILRWLKMEQAGDRLGSLDDVVAQLVFPLAPVA
jgi:hypothetical protein